MILIKNTVNNPALAKLKGLYNFQFVAHAEGGKVNVQTGTMEFDGMGNMAFLSLNGTDPVPSANNGADYTVDLAHCLGTIAYRQHVIASSVPLPGWIGYVATPDYSQLLLASLNPGDTQISGQAFKIS